MKFQEAKCPNCGGDLQVPKDKTTVKCMYCGTDISVQKAIEAVHSGQPGIDIDKLYMLARTAKESNNPTEAYSYYTRIIEADPTQYIAWFERAESSGLSSTLADLKLTEMDVGFKKSIEFAPDDKKEEVKRNAAEVINSITMSYYNIAYNHLMQFISLDDTWIEFLNRCDNIGVAFVKAHEYNPTNKQIIQNIINLCDKQINGVAYKNQFAEGILDSYATRSITPQYKQLLLSRKEIYVNKIKELDPTYVEPKKSMCFIATATMGSDCHPLVVVLKEFRDTWLMERDWGKTLIKHYYILSPPIADIISKSHLLKRLSYLSIVKPMGLFAGLVLKKNQSKYQE